MGPSPEIRQVKVNKLQVNPFLQPKQESSIERKFNKEGPIRINKLAKNAFIQQLEKPKEREEILLKKGTSSNKKSQPEIKFTSKKTSLEHKKEEQDSIVLKPK